jgi:hypothetical protein
MDPFRQQIHGSAGQEQKIAAVATDGVERGAMRAVAASDNDAGSWLFARPSKLTCSVLTIEFHNLCRGVAKIGERLAQMLAAIRPHTSCRRIDHCEDRHETLLSGGCQFQTPAG